MKTLEIFHIAGIGFYAVTSEFEGAGFPIPDNVFEKMRSIHQVDEERGSEAAIALFIQLRSMENIPLALLKFAGESVQAMKMVFEIAPELDEEISKFLATSEKELQEKVKEDAVIPNETTLKVYALNTGDEGLVVISDEPDVGVLIPLDVLRIIGSEELSSEAGQQAFIAAIEAGKEIFGQEKTSDFVLNEEDVIYSITYVVASSTIH